MKKKKVVIKLIIIDFYGVMTFGSYKDTALWIAKKYKIPYKRVYDILYHKHFAAASVGKISETQMFAKTSKELGLGLTWQELQKKHLSYLVLNKPVFEFCKSLQGKGYRVLLLSKNTPGQMEKILRKYNIRKYFKNIINTFQFGLPKADPRVIKKVLKRFRVKPQEVVMVDDQGFNLVALKKMGGEVVLYKRFKDFKLKLKRFITPPSLPLA